MMTYGVQVKCKRLYASSLDATQHRAASHGHLIQILEVHRQLHLATSVVKYAMDRMPCACSRSPTSAEAIYSCKRCCDFATDYILGTASVCMTSLS